MIQRQKIGLRSFACLALASAISGAMLSPVAAGTTSWTNATGNHLWADPGNWSAGVPAASDLAILSQSPGGLVDLGGGLRQLGTIETVGNYQIANGSLDVQIFAPFGGNSTVSADLTNSAGGELWIFGVGVGGSAALTVSGSIYGNIGFNGAATLTGTNTYTGDTVSGDLLLSGNGSSLNSPYFLTYFSIGTLALDYAAGSFNRIADTAQIDLWLSTMSVRNTGALPASETVGTISLVKSQATLRVGQTAGGAMTLIAGALDRGAAGTGEIDVNPAGGSFIKLSNVPSQIGTGADATHRRIVPWLLSTSGNLVTYDTGANASDPSDDIGLRALDPTTEYAPAISPGASHENVRLTTPATVGTASTINALAIHNTSLTVSSPLTIDSGAIVFSRAGSSGSLNAIGGDGTIIVPGEAVLHSTGLSATYHVDAPIAASSLTRSGEGNVVLSRANQIPGGVVINSGNLTSAANGALGDGTIRLAEGALAFTDVSQAYGTLVLDGGLNHGSFSYTQGSSIIVEDGTVATIDALLGRGTSGLSGGGTLRVVGDSHAGAISLNVNNSVFEVDATLENVSASGLSSTSIITGNGMLFAVSSGGLSPGVGIGRFTVGSVVSTPISTFFPASLEIELAGDEPGVTYDQLVVLSSLSLTNRVLDVSLLDGFVPAIGEQFTIVDDRFAAALTTTFSGLPEGSVFSAGGSNFQISYMGGDGNDIVLTTVIPEPATPILAAAAAMLGARLLRRR